VIVPSGGPADNATPSVRRRRFRASRAHHGSAERPRGDSPRPSAESDRDKLNRCVVFQDCASDGASIDGTLRDANGRQWPVGLVPALPSTEAMTVATTAKTVDQRRERAGSSERGRPIGAAEQDTQVEGLDASTRLTGRRRPLGRRQASRVEWPITAPTSTCSCLDEIMASDRRVSPGRRAESLRSGRMQRDSRYTPAAPPP
jgi:hypothetical protein